MFSTGAWPQDQGLQGKGNPSSLSGKASIDIHRFKPAREWARTATAEAAVNQQMVGAYCDPAHGSSGKWVNYAHRTAHPILHWLSSKLAKWIGDNYGADLGIPPRIDVAG